MLTGKLTALRMPLMTVGEDLLFGISAQVSLDAIVVEQIVAGTG